MKTKTLYEVQIRDCESNKLLAVLGAYNTEEEADKLGTEHVTKFYDEYTEYQIKKINRKVDEYKSR